MSHAGSIFNNENDCGPEKVCAWNNNTVLSWDAAQIKTSIFRHIGTNNVVLSDFKGVFGILWYVMWLLLAYGSPADHPTITEEERLYIEAAIGETVNQLSVTEVCMCQDNIHQFDC